MRKKKKVLVLGLGASGAAAARLLLADGAHPTVIDRADHAGVREAAHLLDGQGARILPCGVPIPEDRFDFAVVSPGVPFSSPWIKLLQRRGIPLLSELEWAWCRARGPVLAITGSNGKSSAAAWCAQALRKAGRAPRLAGNSWTAFSAAVLESPHADPWVLEVSSFQLETMHRFRPDVGLLLNILPNHLDRHASMLAYRRLKMRLFRAMQAGDTAVLPPRLARSLRGRSCRRLTFGGPGSRAAFRVHRSIVWHAGKPIIDLSGSVYNNEIMAPSGAGITAALAACGTPGRVIEEALQDMRPLPHRMQRVGVLRDIPFINNSKATNLAALVAALYMAPGRVLLLAGGLAKETDFSCALQALSARARRAYLFGTAAKAMYAAWSDHLHCTPCHTLEEAANAAWRDAKAGDTILLAPGCASFDQFSGFEERGDLFAAVFRKLEKKNPAVVKLA